MKRRICVITGTRADYGLLRWVMQGIADHPGLQLQIIATGMHLSEEFGLSYTEIEADGFHIDRRVPCLSHTDCAGDIATATASALTGICDALADLSPDIVVVLGDRFEAFAAATAALLRRIPLAHLHGGELTEGAMDEAFRHSITKMSDFHFVAADAYRRRVIQLGEDPVRVFQVGGLGVDILMRTKLLDREQLQSSMNFRFRSHNLLITFHSATLEAESPRDQMAALLRALDGLQKTGLIFTYPNADSGGRALIEQINGFVATREHAVAFKSLGYQRYLSTVAQVDAVVGNSSSGLLEVPSLGKATLNIGSRQQGRLKATSVYDCEAHEESIEAGLQHILAEEFQTRAKHAQNPYGDGGASESIVGTLATLTLDKSAVKRFHDLPFID